LVDLRNKGYDSKEDYGTYGTPEPVPIDDYKVMIVQSEDFDTKSGTGVRTQLVFEIIEGPHKGRKLFENLNLINENPIAVRIARAELSAICVACGGLKPQATEELHHIPMIAKVGQKKREDTGDMQNTIKKFSALNTETAAAATAPAAKAEDARQAPWKKKDSG